MVPSGTKLPCAASLTGMDFNDPSFVSLGIVCKFTQIKNGLRMFMCETWISKPNKTIRKELSENQIELLDMPIDGFPMPGNIAP